MTSSARAAWLLAASLAVFAARSEAQSFPLTLSCNDRNGHAVAGVQVTNGIIAKATTDRDGRLVIEYDPRTVAGISGQQQLFIYAHECGHHALDHLRGDTPPTAAQEEEADCYGVRALMNKAGFTSRDVAILQSDMQQLGSGDARRLPWRMRSYNLEACIAVAPQRETARAPSVDDCVLHRDEDNAIVNESRDRKAIDGLYSAANKCTRDMACTFTIQTGTMPDGDFDAEIWDRFQVQKTRTEQHIIKTGADAEFRFHESLDDVPAGQSVDFRVLRACK